MELFKGKVVCPRCDGNGLVYKAKVKELNQILYVCDECDASWDKNDEISKKNFVDFDTYLGHYGYTYYHPGDRPYKYIEVVNIGYDWYTQ